MKLPPDVQFIKEPRLFIWRPRGVIDESAVNKVISVLGDLEMEAGEGFNRFSDSSGADAVELNFRFVFHVSLYRRLSYYGPAVRSAVLVTSPAHGQWSKMHELLTQGSALKVRVFKEREKVARWLGVPNELLASPSNS